jgi:hypothetical protein
MWSWVGYRNASFTRSYFGDVFQFILHTDTRSDFNFLEVTHSMSDFDRILNDLDTLVYNLIHPSTRDAVAEGCV